MRVFSRKLILEAKESDLQEIALSLMSRVYKLEDENVSLKRKAESYQAIIKHQQGVQFKMITDAIRPIKSE